MPENEPGPVKQNDKGKAQVRGNKSEPSSAGEQGWASRELRPNELGAEARWIEQEWAQAERPGQSRGPSPELTRSALLFPASR